MRDWAARTNLELIPPSVRTVLFRAADSYCDQARDLGWGRLCGNLAVVPVEGVTTCFRAPHLSNLCTTFVATVLDARHKSFVDAKAPTLKSKAAQREVEPL